MKDQLVFLPNGSSSVNFPRMGFASLFFSDRRCIKAYQCQSLLPLIFPVFWPIDSAKDAKIG